jgi:hypothetical protein
MAECLKLAELREQPGIYPSAESMIADLLADHEKLIRRLREDVKRGSDCDDTGTADFLAGMLRQHEHVAWMLRALLQDNRREIQSAALSSAMSKNGHFQHVSSTVERHDDCCWTGSCEDIRRNRRFRRSLTFLSEDQHAKTGLYHKARHA